MTRRGGGGNRGHGSHSNNNREGDDEESTQRQPRNQNFDDIIEQMLESRHTTREGALRDLAHKLGQDYNYDAVDSFRSTIGEGLKKSFKKGGDAEQQLAAHALSTVVLTLGADADELYTEFEPMLIRAIEDGLDGEDSNYSPEARAEFIVALAMLSFVASSDSADSKKHMTLFEKFFAGHGDDNSDSYQQQPQHDNSANNTVPQLTGAALRGWSFLITTMDSRYAIDNPITDHVSSVVALLESSDVDVRLAAGEAIALIFAMLFEDSQDEDNDNNNDGSDDDAYDVHELADRFQIDTHELLNQLKDLSVSKDRQRNKKEMLKQKGKFKDIARSVENGEVPDEVLVIDGQPIEFFGWRQLIQLNRIRDQLAGGLQDHLENNDLLGQIFEFSLQKGAPKGKMSKVQKRLLISSNSASSKARSRNRNTDRARYSRSSSSGTSNYEEAD